MKFVDSIEIRVRSGKGGPGLVSFRSVKGKAKMGCDGGDGGFGGNVYLEGDSGLNTLSTLFYKKLYSAEDGEKGGSNNRTGRNGKDMVIPVPLGTIACDLDKNEKICEVLEDGRHYLVARGGKRGLGNNRYLSSVHQAPEENTLGGSSTHIRLGLELKLIADVGFAGFPNAGKSTLLSKISSAKPKIADYPFTTLVPHLGVVSLPDIGNDWGRSFVAADIPGLIEGASEGRGLGHAFLRHLERTQIILYVIDGFCEGVYNPEDIYDKLREEVGRYSQNLYEKETAVVITKTDLLSDEKARESLIEKMRIKCPHVMAVSAVTGECIEALKYFLYDLIMEEKKKVRIENFEVKDQELGYELYTKIDDPVNADF
ncbi:MAG: GTPase ObgE [Oligoflexales bacterium]|nr:GTPase ObgE [Oligoflexales bacterium]